MLYTGRVNDICQDSDEQILSDYLKVHSLERLIQLIVDEMIDINTHIIWHGNLNTPDDFQSSFKILAQGDILPKEFAERLAPIVGLCNRLVHRYEVIKADQLLKMIRQEQQDFYHYVNYVNNFLKSGK